MTQVAERKDLTNRDECPQYRGLPTLLHRVRWTQQFFAIVAEVLILVSFAASGMDVSIGGAMARMDALAWIWAAIFAIGVDTSFVVSWVRVRQTFDQYRWGAFIFNLILAIGMSIIVFQPVAIQLLQQSLAISFGQALNMLGMNIVQLVYARAIVAVLLGALLATTNVEQKSVTRPSKRRMVWLEQFLNKVAPVVSSAPTFVFEERVETPLNLPESDGTASETPLQLPETVGTPDVTRDRDNPRPGYLTSLVEYLQTRQEERPQAVFARPEPVETPGERLETETEEPDLQAQIATLLAENPGLSTREIAARVNRPHSTVYRQVKQVKLRLTR